MIKYCLDTDHWIFWLNGDRFINRKLSQIGPSRIAVVQPTLAELYYGAYNSSRVNNNLHLLETILQSFPILDLDLEDLRRFGKIKAELNRRGRPLDDFDILIASMALERDLVVVTHNVKHFEQIPGIKIEDWKNG